MNDLAAIMLASTEVLLKEQKRLDVINKRQRLAIGLLVVSVACVSSVCKDLERRIKKLEESKEKVADEV